VSSFTLCSKSPWRPAMRREHALVSVALGRGVGVSFVEPPTDVRQLGTTGPVPFVRALGGTVDGGVAPGLQVVARSAPVPGHRGRAAEQVDNALLTRVLARHTDPREPTVCTLPWQWPATSGRGRRVFDCTDDWTRLYPGSRTPRFRQLFARIAAEADQVIVVSPDLARLFAGREVQVVPNGADADAIAASATPRPGGHVLAYVGTLSERFDAGLVAGVLDARPEWRLELYGPCAYAGTGDRPAPELVGLLEGFGDRVRWHGTVRRDAVAGALDGADVAIVPNRTELSEGQSSMKLYDTAARGRPVVVTPGVGCAGPTDPPGTYVADGVEAWVAALDAAAAEGDGPAAARLDWARANTWDQRWPDWADGVFGDRPVVAAGA